MTVCLYGSGPRPGAPNGFWLTLQGVLSFLPSVLNGWLAWSPDWLDGLYVSTADLCAAPQPVVGAFPAADYLACQLSPVTQYGGSCQVVRSWFSAYVRALLWANQCQCVAGTADCPITPPGTQVVNWTQTGAGSRVFPILATTTHIRNIEMSVGSPQYLGGNFMLVRLNDGSGVELVRWTFNGVPISPYSQPFADIALAGYPTAATFETYSSSNDTGRTYQTQATWNWCRTPGAPTYLPAPATPAQPSGIVSLPSGACSTTADLCTELLRLEQYVSELTGTVNYLTRQLAPYSYSFGTPSSGLSGTGYVAVTECMGVLVTLTTIPTTKGRQSGTPTRYFDVGRINWGDVNGYHAHHPVHSSPELILGIPETATRIGYTFPAGVVATIMPVKRV